MFQLFMLLAARWYASNYLVLDMSVASVVVRSLNKCPQTQIDYLPEKFHFMTRSWFLSSLQSIMSWLLSLCVQKPPAAVTDVSSMSGVHVNHRTGTGTSGTRLPHRHQATWHVPGPGDTCLGHVACAGRAGGDWTGLGSTLFCCVPRWFICCCPAPVWVARSLRRLRPAGRANIKHMAGTSLHPFITRLRIRWTSVHQPRHLDVAVASPCLFIFIQLAWTHNTAACHRHHQPGGQKVD